MRNLLQNSISRSGQGEKISIEADQKSISISNPSASTDAADLNSLLQKTEVSSSQSGLDLQIAK